MDTLRQVRIGLDFREPIAVRHCRTIQTLRKEGTCLPHGRWIAPQAANLPIAVSRSFSTPTLQPVPLDRLLHVFDSGPAKLDLQPLFLSALTVHIHRLQPNLSAAGLPTKLPCAPRRSGAERPAHPPKRREHGDSLPLAKHGLIRKHARAPPFDLHADRSVLRSTQASSKRASSAE